jgi:hypothetical protein
VDLAAARLRLGLDDATVRVVEDALRREELPSSREKLDRWTVLAAEGWASRNPETETPYKPAGFLVAFIRKQVSLERRRKRAAAQGKTIREDRAAFWRAFYDAYDEIYEEKWTAWSPAPPLELAPHHGQLYSAWRDRIRTTAEWETLDRLAALEGPVGEMAAALTRAREQEARERRAAYRSTPDQFMQDRLDLYLIGVRSHLSPRPSELPEDEPI